MTLVPVSERYVVLVTAGVVLVTAGVATSESPLAVAARGLW